MSRISAQRALEALRNGVPNADAVRALGCMQPEVFDSYRSRLTKIVEATPDAAPATNEGMLISGGFGSGKSHTLSYFELDALKRGFVVSRIVISKETPLYDPSKLFVAAVRNAKIPDSRGPLLQELTGRIDYRSKAATAFLEWVKHRQHHQILAASVLIHEQSSDPELRERVIEWWAGGRIEVAQIREGLKTLEMRSSYVVKAIRNAELAPIRFEFVSRLIQASGYAGWVLLLDEVELIGRYSLLQRARSYAELSRWLVSKYAIPGILSVAAITDDFDIAVLTDRQDETKASEKLRQKGDQRSLEQAEKVDIAVQLIANDALRLRSPSDDTLRVTLEKLMTIYAEAYDHHSSDRIEPVDGGLHRSMRSYVRRWISEWDLDRLYGEQDHNIIEEETSSFFGEDSELEPDEGVGDA